MTKKLKTLLRLEPSNDEIEAVIFDMTLKLDLTLKSIMDKMPQHMTLKHKRLTRVRKIILRWLGRFNSMETKRKCFTPIGRSDLIKLKGTERQIKFHFKLTVS